MKQTKRYVVVLGGTSGLGAAIADEYLKRGKGVIVMGTSAPVYRHSNPDTGYYPLPDHGELPPWPPKLEERVAMHALLDYEISTIKAAKLVCEYIEINDLYIDALVWTAGTFSRTPFIDRDGAKLIDINLRNPLCFIHHLVSTLIELRSNRFTLVVVSCTAGLSTMPSARESIYGATKAAQIHFARAMGRDPFSRGLKVALFCPSGMKTSFWRRTKDVDMTYFLDPKKVASTIVDDVTKQQETYHERILRSGSV